MNIVCRLVDFKKKDKKGFLCFCQPPEDNPKLVIERQGEALEGTKKIKWIQVYESEVMEGNLSPEYNDIKLNMFQLCQNQIKELEFQMHN